MQCSTWILYFVIMKSDAKRLFNDNIKVLQTTPYSLEVILNFTNGMIRAHNVMCNKQLWQCFIIIYPLMFTM